MRNWGYIPDRFDPRDEKYKVTLKQYLRGIPQSVDLRSNCPPIRNQYDLGACTGFGVSFVYELALQIKGWLDPAELFAYFNGRYIGGYPIHEDTGAQIRDVIKGAVRYGICDEKLWPYDTSKFADEPPSACYRDAKKHKALKYESIPANDRAMKQVLADGFGITLGIMLYSSFMSQKVADTGLVPYPDVENEEEEGGHCIGICGYDDITDLYLGRNSWGTDWGMNGYFWIPKKYLLDKQICMDRWTIRRVAL